MRVTWASVYKDTLKYLMYIVVVVDVGIDECVYTCLSSISSAV